MSRKIHRNPPRPLGQLAIRLVPLEDSLTQVASFHLAQIIPPRPSPPSRTTQAATPSRLCWSNPPTDPSVIMIRWPDAPTITTPATFKVPAAEAMKILPDSSTPSVLRSGLNGDVDWLDGGLWQTD
jgi:hypothetical protein